MEPLKKQLEELQLITCSLLPGESITYLQDDLAWTKLLEDLTVNSEGLSVPSGLRPAHFQTKVENAKIWFEADLSYVNTSRPPQVSIKGEDMTRFEQERWRQIVQDKILEIADTE